jgi:all-trans-retinol 13,14-reductase
MKTLLLIFRDFIPLLVALLLHPAWVGSIVAFLLASMMLMMQIRQRKVKTLTVINTLYFLMACGILLFFPTVPILQYGQVTTYLVLFLSTTLSLFVGELFTVQYAKETTPPAVWGHPLFLSINRILTRVWSSVFFLSACFSILVAKGFLPLIPGMIAANAWCVLGIIANSTIPSYMQRKYVKQMGEQKMPELEWEPEIAAQRPNNMMSSLWAQVLVD